MRYWNDVEVGEAIDAEPLLIVPWGIEIKWKEVAQAAEELLIVPWGIEMSVNAWQRSRPYLLIVPWGIEIHDR